MLIQLVGVVSPGASASLQFSAWLVAGHFRHPVLALAGIGRGTQVHVQVPLLNDCERMHRMIARDGHSGYDRFRRSGRRDPVRGQRVPDNSVVRLGIDVAFVDCDAGASGIAVGLGRTEGDSLVRLTVALGVLQGDQHPAGRRCVVSVVEPAPGVDKYDSVRGNRKVPGVTKMVGEDRRAETRGQRDAAIVPGARRRTILMRCLGERR
jgi:hypothetical protein